MVAVIFAVLVIPAHVRRGRAEGGIDVPGIVVSAGGLFLLTLALVQGNSWGWTSPAIIGLFVAAFACFPFFVWWELRTAHPMFPFELLRIRSFTAANTAIMLIGIAMGGTFLLVVIFMVSVLGYSELRAALALTDHAADRAGHRAQLRSPRRPHRPALARPCWAPRSSPSGSFCWPS